MRTSKRQSQSPIEGFVQFPSTFYTPDALGYMSHSLNRSHIRLAYFQPMASCLADGFFPSRLICKIKNFFDVFFTFFSYFLLELAELKTHKEIRMPAGFLEMHLQALSVRASRSFPDIKAKKHKKAPLRSGAVLKKRLAREINEIEIFRNIQ